MTICSEDVLNHLTKLGYTGAVNEIKKLLNKDKTLNNRFHLYINRLEEFAKNFGPVFTIAWTRDTIELEFEEWGYSERLRSLAKNMNGYYYEYEEDVSSEYDSDKSNTLVVNKSWFELIMHLWINKYSDYDYDIYQSRLM